MEVTTIHVLGLEEASGNMEVAYDNALQVPIAVETLEVTASLFMFSISLGRRRGLSHSVTRLYIKVWFRIQEMASRCGVVGCL
jgi:hypothetical protein